MRSDVIVDRPADLQTALNAVAEDPDALVVAGGTDVMVAVNYRRVEPDHIVSLDQVEELRDWCFDDDAKAAFKKKAKEAKAAVGAANRQKQHGDFDDNDGSSTWVLSSRAKRELSCRRKA